MSRQAYWHYYYFYYCCCYYYYYYYYYYYLCFYYNTGDSSLCSQLWGPRSPGGTRSVEETVSAPTIPRVLWWGCSNSCT